MLQLILPLLSFFLMFSFHPSFAFIIRHHLRLTRTPVDRKPSSPLLAICNLVDTGTEGGLNAAVLTGCCVPAKARSTRLRESGTLHRFSVLPFLLLKYCAVINKPLHLSAPVSLPVNSAHSSPCLKHYRCVNCYRSKCFLGEKKKKSTFLRGWGGWGSKGGSQSWVFLAGCLGSGCRGSRGLCSLPQKRKGCSPCSPTRGLPLGPSTEQLLPLTASTSAQALRG